MITSRIYIDGLAYKGESADKTYKTNIGADGWHIPNQVEINVLIIEDGEPKEIQGIRNLKSEIERIMKRIQDKQIDVNKITIELTTPLS